MKKKKDKFIQPKILCMEYSNNWRRLHHHPMGRKGKIGCVKGCPFPFC